MTDFSSGGWSKVETSPTWDFKKDKELVGVYTFKEESVGENKSNLYTIEKKDGTRVGVWGNAILDSRFKNISVGEEVGIVYLGMETGEKSGRAYHNFDVFNRALSS